MKRLVLILFLIGCAFGQGTVGGTGQGSGTGQMGILPLPTQFVLTITISGFGTVTGSPNGAGNIPLICPGTCAVSYTSGTVVTLTESPGGGQTFSVWGGACAVSATTCVLTITAPTSVSATFTGGGGGGGFVAQEPTSWVDNTICNPTGGIYDQTITLGVSVNNGPNVTSGAIGSVYPVSAAGFRDAYNNYRDNGANINGGSGYTDANWLIRIPPSPTIHDSIYDSNSALFSLPGKMSGGVETSKCLTIDSTTPLPSYTVTGAVTSGTFTNGERVRQSTSLAEATLYSAPAGSGAMVVQSALGGNATGTFTTGGTLTSSAVGFPSNTHAGNLLYMVIWIRLESSNASCTILQSGVTLTTSGFSWTVPSSGNFTKVQDDATANHCGWVESGYILNAAQMLSSTTSTVAVTIPSGNHGTANVEFALYEVSGISAFSDVNGGQVQSSGAASNPSCLTTASGVFYFCNLMAIPGSNLTAASGYTLGPNATTATIGQTAYSLSRTGNTAPNFTGNLSLWTTSATSFTVSGGLAGSSNMLLGPMTGYPDQASMFTWVGQSSGAIYTPTSTPNRFMVCGRGLPGFGGTRNPGCDGHVAGPNDKASLWKVQLDSPLTGKSGIFSEIDLVTPSNYVNHVVLRNFEITEAPGSAQSAAGAQSPVLFKAASGSTGTYVFGVGPTLNPVSKRIGLENYYVHGWDPGDAGQPAGACSAWTNEGYVTVAPDGGGINSTVTWQALFSSTINTYFGMTFKPGSLINIGGTNYTIANTTLTQNVLNGLANTTLSIVGTVTIATNTLYTQSNPPTQYANGCGDDVQSAVQFNCDSCWREGGYIEKVHHWGSESHGTSQGFDAGPQKDLANWEEGGSLGWFSGGNPLDTSGGPGADNEIRKNYFGRDLNWRQLSATASASPAPPFGCAVIPSDSGGHPVASHNTCPFNWAIKNSFEMKMATRNLIDGNIMENSWSDGQSGFIYLSNVETNSGGATGGGYDAGTGLPKTLIRDVRMSNNWLRNAPQPLQMDNRSAGQTQTGSNGGGVSQSEGNIDYFNNAFTNIADSAQFGKVGTGQLQWTAGGEDFPCTMSYTGSVAPFTVTAACQPAQVGMHGWVTKISKDASNVVTVLKTQRTDPYLCLTTPSDCVAKGFTLIMTVAPGWNGTFAMSGTTGNWFTDGTGGHDVIYTDNINPVSGAAVLCDNAVSANKCSANPYVMTVASLAMKMTDIAVGDGVRAFDVGGGDTTCTTNGFAAGTNSSVVASTGTLILGLTVVYQINTQPSQPTANCMVSNRVGIPKNMVVRNNTFMSPNYMAITAFANWYQSINNTFNDNVFISNDSGNHSHMYCTGKGGGAGSLVCWDLNTLKFYHNVMPQVNAANWGCTTGALSGSCAVVNCPSGACVHSFPTTVNCPTATADATCIGYSGFMGGSPTVTYPTGSCVYDGSNPFNCPLMALPWANNLTIDNLSYVGSSLFSTQGVDVTALKNAFARTKYVCTGACGDGSAGHHPYPD